MSYNNPFIQEPKDPRAYSEVNKCIGKVKFSYTLERNGVKDKADEDLEKIEIFVDLKDPASDDTFSLHRTWRNIPNIQDVAWNAVSDFAIANGLAEDFEVDFKMLEAIKSEHRNVDNEEWVRLHEEGLYLVFHTLD